MDRGPDAIFIGSSKAGSTWLWHCFRHHPQIFVHADTDNSHRYTLLHHLEATGEQHELFAGAAPGQVTVEMCNDYLIDDQAPARIFADDPNVKLIACLREPISRAFSHLSHGRRRGGAVFEPEDLLTSYMAYRAVLTPGFYADPLERYFRLFPRQRMLILFYDELVAHPGGFLRKIYDFLGVEAIDPPILDQRINQAAPPPLLGRRAEARARHLLERVGLLGLARRARKRLAGRRPARPRTAHRAPDAGIPPGLRAQLLRVTVPEVEKLEKLLGVELPHWKQ